ncbi:hypothetical protein ACH3XW_22175 [Acanthocheilonema viteae]
MIGRIQLTVQLAALCGWLFRVLWALCFVWPALGTKYCGNFSLSKETEVLGMGIKKGQGLFRDTGHPFLNFQLTNICIID